MATEEAAPRFFARNPRVLAADDDPVAAMILKNLLRHHGVDTGLARHGKEAVEMWEDGSYEAILMDVEMPTMDGLEASKQIREREQRRGGHVPIIALTGHDCAENEEAYRSAGMDACITKPVDFRKALTLLKELLEK